MEHDILERAIAAVVAAETGRRTGKRARKVDPVAALAARIEFARAARTHAKRRFVVTVPRRGRSADVETHVATTEVPVGPDEATREIDVARREVSGRFVVTIPRSLLEPLFATGLAGLSAETELADAFATFAVAVCEHVLRASHGTDDFELAKPIVEPTVAVVSSSVVVGVLDQWIAAELAEDCSATWVRPLPRLAVAR